MPRYWRMSIAHLAHAKGGGRRSLPVHTQCHAVLETVSLVGAAAGGASGLRVGRQPRTLILAIGCFFRLVIVAIGAPCLAPALDFTAGGGDDYFVSPAMANISVMRSKG